MPKRRDERALAPAARESVLERFLPFRIHKLAARLGFSDEFRTRSGAHIKVREWRVLFLLNAADGLSNAEICELLDMDPATISRAVKTLSDQKLVTVASSREDGRKLISKLTPQGRLAYEEIAPTRIAYARQIEGCLTPAEQVALYAILDKLDKHCADLRQSNALQSDF